MKEEMTYERACKQVHRMHRPAVRLSLRQRQLLFSGPDYGGYPRAEPHHGPVHRLQVLPQEVSVITAASAAVIFLDENGKNFYHGHTFFTLMAYHL